MEMTERVRRGDIKNNAPHYPSNPFETNCHPAAPREFGDDDMVWILYHYETERWGYFKPGRYDPPAPQSGLTILAGIVNNLDADSF